MKETTMHKIILINGPFASVYRPSIALTQLQSVLHKRFGEQVKVEVLYLNHDFAHYIGVDVYQDIAEGIHYNFGLGDWFFRQIAFPEQAENSQAYFARYYPQNNSVAQQFKQLIREKREGLDDYLDTLIAKYRIDQAMIIGFTSMFSQNVACFALAKRLKERNPALITVMGGANCETPMGQEIVKHVPAIDYVFSGPGLANFPNFVQHCLGQTMEQCHQIDGVLSKVNCLPQLPQRRTTGKPVMIQAQGIRDIGVEVSIENEIELDYGPFLDTFERNFPGGKIVPYLLFETSRGCWWGERSHCTFCGLNGLTMNYRAMSPQQALQQFDALFKYAPRIARLESVDNILPKSYFKEVLPWLETPLEVTLFYEVKSNLSEADVQLLSKARVKTIQPGIEALATSTLQLMKKGSTAFQNVLLLKNCAIYDVFPIWNLLVGFPDEEEDVYKKYLHDMPLLTHLPPPSGVYPVRFDRYSPYFAAKEQYELDLHSCDFYSLTYPFAKESLEQLAYYFTDHNFGAAYTMTMIKWLRKMREVHKQWWSVWHDQDRLPPRLYFQPEEEGHIYDSRSGEVRVHRVSAVGRQILDHLQKAARCSDLELRLPAVAKSEIEQEVMELQEKGLVFTEGQKYLSLVLPDAAYPLERCLERAKANKA
jgi:ribosomal peptide maturation radical SAM protein 1